MKHANRNWTKEKLGSHPKASAKQYACMPNMKKCNFLTGMKIGSITMTNNSNTILHLQSTSSFHSFQTIYAIMGLRVSSLKTSSCFLLRAMGSEQDRWCVCWELKALVPPIKLSAVSFLPTTLHDLALGNKIYTHSLRVGQSPTHMGLESPKEGNLLTC